MAKPIKRKHSTASKHEFRLRRSKLGAWSASGLGNDVASLELVCRAARKAEHIVMTRVINAFASSTKEFC